MKNWTPEAPRPWVWGKVSRRTEVGQSHVAVRTEVTGPMLARVPSITRWTWPRQTE